MNRIGNQLSIIESKFLEGIHYVWNWMKRHPLWSFVITIGLISTYFLFFRYILHYTTWAAWTGLEPITKIIISSDGKITKEISPGKNIWDFLGIILGVFVALLIAVLNEQNQTRRKQTELEIAADQQRETTLRTYLDDMGKLLLDNKLKDEKDAENSPVIDIAQVKTITALRALDISRRNYIFQFLRDAQLKDYLLQGASLNILDLSNNYLDGFNLKKANLSYSNLTFSRLSDIFLTNSTLIQTILRAAILNNSDLSNANLTWANLDGAYLEQANLSGANLHHAYLDYANLHDANLSDADLTDADLSGAFLDHANLNGAHLNNANLTGADLIDANLTCADLRRANLNGANLTKSDLTHAEVTMEQLAQARYLKGATMPDGTVHE